MESYYGVALLWVSSNSWDRQGGNHDSDKKKNNQNILHVGCDSRHLNRIRKKQRSPLREESPRAGHEPGRGGGSGRNAAAEFPAFHGNSAKAGATWAVGRNVLKILLGNGNVWEAPPVCGTGD